MNNVIALLENTETRALLESNSVLIENAVNDLGCWYEYLNRYIIEHAEEFVEDTLEETAKSVYTFSTFSTKQMLCEISHIYGTQLNNAQILKESAKNEFV